MGLFNWGNKDKGTKAQAGTVEKPAAATAKDPVCGMTVNTQKAAGSSVHEGQTYYFCNAACKKAFDADPARYLKGGGKPASGRSCCGM